MIIQERIKIKKLKKKQQSIAELKTLINHVGYYPTGLIKLPLMQKNIKKPYYLSNPSNNPRILTLLSYCLEVKWEIR